MVDGPLSRDEFEGRYVIAADTFGYIAGPDEVDRAYEEYADGRLALHLVDPTPEAAVQERVLAASIDGLLDDPHPDDWRWRNRLAARLDQLAAITRPAPAGARDPDDEPWPRERLLPARSLADDP